MSTATLSRHDACAAYRETRVMTAGKLGSVLLLVARAKQLIRKIEPNAGREQPELIQCRNIIAQLEMGLDFYRGEAAPEIFSLYELVYAALLYPTEKSLINATFLLSHYETTLNILRRGG